MWSNLPETANLVTFIEKILNGKLHFLDSVYQKETPTQVAFCEYYKIFKNTHFTEDL